GGGWVSRRAPGASRAPLGCQLTCKRAWAGFRSRAARDREAARDETPAEQAYEERGGAALPRTCVVGPRAADRTTRDLEELAAGEAANPPARDLVPKIVPLTACRAERLDHVLCLSMGRAHSPSIAVRPVGLQPARGCS